MASKSSRKQKTKIISKEDVLEQLRYSCTFSWCVYRKRGIIRHVGIIIKFDGKPFCTVDFEVEIIRRSCLFACRSKVFIKRVRPGFENGVDYWGDDIQCLNTRNDYWRYFAETIIDNLVTPNHDLYSLLINNCRDNTRDVLNRVCNYGQCCGANLKDTKQMLQITENEDLRLFLIVILVCALGIPRVLSFFTRT